MTKQTNNMNPAKTPSQVARAFGCAEEQARAHNSGKVRGLSAEWFAERAAAFEAVL